MNYKKYLSMSSYDIVELKDWILECKVLGYQIAAGVHKIIRTESSECNLDRGLIFKAFINAMNDEKFIEFLKEERVIDSL